MGSLSLQLRRGKPLTGLNAMLRPSLALAVALGLSALAGCKAGPKVEEVARAMSAAVFFENRLSTCVDLMVSPGPSEETPSLEVANKAASVVRLSRACAEEFSNRAVLATCVIRAGRAAYVTQIYDVRSVLYSDVHMRECLAAGGDWRASGDRELVERERQLESVRTVQRLTGN
jgi:hypothetical protein